MRILLIGGNGFIGSFLTDQLRRANHQVAILHRGTHSGKTGDVVHLQGDRNRLNDSRKQIEQFSPEVIVDLLLSSGEQARQLLGVSRGVTGRVVAISSMDVYRAWGVLHGIEPGGVEPLPLTEEESPLRSIRTLYSTETLSSMKSIFSWLDDYYDKIAVEEIVMSESSVATILRLPMVYGPGDRLHRLFPVLKRFGDGRAAILLSDDLAAWRGPRGYVENVAHAIALAATSEHASGRVYNVCEEPALSELEWQKRIAKHMSWPGRFVVMPRHQVPKHLLSPGNAAQHVVASSQRIRSELGYQELVAADDAMERTISWELANPPARIDPQQFDYDAEDAALAKAA